MRSRMHLRVVRGMGDPPAATLTVAQRQAILNNMIAMKTVNPTTGLPIPPGSTVDPTHPGVILPPSYAGATGPASLPGEGFWESASTGEKFAIVGGGLGAAVLLWLALRKKKR